MNALFRIPLFVCLAIVLFPATSRAIPGVRSVKITNTRSDWFYIEEVEILNDADVDVASLAFGSSAAANSGPAFGSAINGAIDDAIGNCCATGWHSADDSTVHEYIISFPSAQTIEGIITVWNRQDGCCSERLDGMHFEFFDGNDGTGALLGEVQVDNLASNSGGAISTSTGAAFVVPEPPTPEIEFFTTDASNITATGDPNLPTSATLSWSVMGADSVSIDNGIGVVPAVGQQSVSPAATTSYILTATNADGDSTAAVTVAVDQPVLPPVLSEFMADNASIVEDQNGGSPDWIEIYNPNGFDLSLDSYFLTDDPMNLTAWRIPAVNVPANGYLIIFASGDNITDPAGPVHTNFQLSKAGDYLALIDTDGTTILDQFPSDYPVTATYPAQKQNVSYGQEAGGAATGYFSPPTPGSANGTSFSGFVDDTKFDIGRGFYNSPINVSITSTTPGATIRYTTNGSDPSPTNGTVYSAPIAVNTTTILRAMAYKSGLAPTNVDTNTYVFVDDVIASPELGVPVTQLMRDSLTAVPSLSIVTPATISGSSEVPTSFELIFPDGTEGFQENCGVKQFGGAFTNFAKKNFRLYFRSEYGASKLKYPIFDGFDRGIAATDTFDQLNIRSGSHDMNQRGFYMSNRFSDDCMLDMGQINPHGRFMHLYINGRYWGVFHVRERWNASTLTEYLGGPKSAHEAINGNWNVGGWADSVIDAYDGDGSAWTRIKALALSSNPNNYEQIRPYLDVPHFIDYMIMWMYGNSEDEYRCTGPADVGSGFKWFLNDADGYLRNTGNRTGFASNTPGVFGRSAGDGPGSIFSLLFKAGNVDYRTLLADRIHKHYFNNGAMTPAETIARLQERCDEMDLPFRSEAIRWNYRTHASWTSEKNAVLSNMLPNRTAAVIGHFRSAGFYPSTDAPSYSQHGGDVPQGFNLTMTGSGGTIYYSTDGSDPRLPGGAINPLAQIYEGGGVTTTIVAEGASWKYLDDGSDQGTAWRASAFDDNSWAAGPAEFGYGEGDEATEVSFGPNPAAKYTTTYFRHSFNVTDAASLTGAQVRIKRDDGAVIYVNGAEVARSSMPSGTVTYQTLANSAPDDGNNFNTIAVAANFFQTGANIMAVEIHQSSLNSSDLSFDLELKLTATSGGNSALNLTENTIVRSRALDGGEWSALNEAFFTVDGAPPVSPGDLVISELHYNPPGPDSSEFMELYNISGNAINLRGSFFTAGIEFAFPDNRDVILAPDERVILVDSQFGVDERYGIGLPIAGVYRGNLDNGGETITLVAEDGVTELLNVTYDGADPWPEEADGDGYSLVLNNPESNPDGSLVESWRVSPMPGGNPGGSDGVAFQGDPGADNDGDGLAAFLEHAFGTSDSLAGDAINVLALGPDITNLTLTFQQNLAAEDVTVSIQKSTNLTDWEPAGNTLTPIGSTTDIYGIQTSEFSVDTSSDGYLYFRVKVEEQLP